MTEEEYFRKNYPDFCYGDKPLSPYWDLFEYGAEFGEQQSEKKIEELTSELTKKADTNHSLVEQMAKLEEENAELKDKLTAIRNAKDKYDMSKDKSVINAFGAEYTLFCDLERILEDWQEDDKLTKAKEILQVVLDKWKKDRWILYSDEKIKQIENLMEQTEQFLREIEK